MSQRIISIQHVQQLSMQAEDARWSETAEVSITLHAEALTSGWLSQFFGRHANDFILLYAIGMFSRPLKGELFRNLLSRNLVAPDDEGRLYATVSDTGLADMLGGEPSKRDTVALCAARLQTKGLLTIVDLSPLDDTGVRHKLRDPQHQFMKSKIYVLAGDLQKHFSKDIQLADVLANAVGHRAEFPRMAGDDRAGFPRMASEARAGFSRTESEAHAEFSRTAMDPAVRDFPAVGAGKLPTNIKQAAAAALPANDFSQDAALAYFLTFKKSAHAFSAKELKARAELERLGYSLAEIQAGIDHAFARPGGCRHFTLAAAIVKNTSPQATNITDSETVPAHPQPEATPRIQPEREARLLEGDVQPEIQLELTRAVEAFKAYGLPVTQGVMNALKGLAEQYDDAALKHASTGAAWVTAALTEGQGSATQPIPYARTILARWAKEGPGTDYRVKAATPMASTSNGKASSPRSSARPKKGLARLEGAFRNVFGDSAHGD